MLTYVYFGDSTQLTYLRARYYNSWMGRFISKDTWEGDYNVPMSYNSRLYVYANPINLFDPSGLHGAPPECMFNDFAKNVKYIEENAGSYLNKSNWLDTYTAAGIAVQCWAIGISNNDDYDGYGPSQITNMQVSTSWGSVIDEDGNIRGYGLRCYIVTKLIPRDRYITSCICEDEKYMINTYGVGNYRLEPLHDQNEMKWAVEYMRRQLKLITDVCERDRRCRPTDKFIAAALGQNGPGFNIVNMKTDVPDLPEINRTPDYKLNWKAFFRNDASLLRINTQVQLSRFNQAIQALITENWLVPSRDTGYINQLINGQY